MELNTDTFNRLALGIIEKDRCSPDTAVNKLKSLRINIEVGETIHSSIPLQGAVLTAINTARRAFLGGVYVKMPGKIKCLLSWPNNKTINDIAEELGGQMTDVLDPSIFTLSFGIDKVENHAGMCIVCNDWQAGILVDGKQMPFESEGTIPTAGIFAGAWAVSLAFLKMAGIQIAACDTSIGVSLWRPDIHWLHDSAKGPKISFLPKKYWLLGLGHLGQAYLWNIGLLPYENPMDATILLQDDDRIVEANYSAGLLSEKKNVQNYKTRVCATWLENRGFKTLISERRFDEYTNRINDEPFLALCGFDSAKSRLQLENAGYDMIVESGLGNALSTFDIIALHTFPSASKTPPQLWDSENFPDIEINKAVLEILQQELDKNETCGIVPLTIAGKAVSASFVGACAGAFVIAELLRGLHGGTRYEKITLQLRNLEDIKAVIHSSNNYLFEHSRNGFVVSKVNI